jgi:osmotically-inducible protein OsmY
MLRKLIAAAFCCLAAATPAAAQFTRSNTGGGTQAYGAFGGRTLGGGISPGGSRFSGNSSGMSGNGLGAMGGTGATGGGGAMGGTGGGVGATPGAGVTGNERFLRQNRQGAFVGADNRDASANVFSQSGQGMGMGMGGMGGFFGQQGAFSQFARMNRQQNNFNNRNQQGSKKPLRVSIRADIPTTNASASPTHVSRQFEARLKKLPALERGEAVQVTMEGRTAILTGTVASERDRELVAGLAMLEPGISSVQNDLRVGPLPTSVEELPVPRR